MAHVGKSYGAVSQRRWGHSRIGHTLAEVLSLLALAVLAGGLIGVVVFEGVRLLLGLIY